MTNPLAAQYDLQVKAYRLDPVSLEEDERAAFFTWNFVALVTELSEASEELGWKPWATSRHLNQDEYVGELVDAFHFFLNLLLLAGIPWQRFMELYLEKRQINADRQTAGYDGVKGKCPHCSRDLPTTPKLHPVSPDGSIYCVEHDAIAEQAPVTTPEANAELLMVSPSSVTQGSDVGYPQNVTESLARVPSPVLRERMSTVDTAMLKAEIEARADQDTRNAHQNLMEAKLPMCGLPGTNQGTTPEFDGPRMPTMRELAEMDGAEFRAWQRLTKGHLA